MGTPITLEDSWYDDEYLLCRFCKSQFTRDWDNAELYWDDSDAYKNPPAVGDHKEECTALRAMKLLKIIKEET